MTKKIQRNQLFLKLANNATRAGLSVCQLHDVLEAFQVASENGNLDHAFSCGMNQVAVLTAKNIINEIRGNNANK